MRFKLCCCIEDLLYEENVQIQIEKCRLCQPEIQVDTCPTASCYVCSSKQERNFSALYSRVRNSTNCTNAVLSISKKSKKALQMKQLFVLHQIAIQLNSISGNGINMDVTSTVVDLIDDTIRTRP